MSRLPPVVQSDEDRPAVSRDARSVLRFSAAVDTTVDGRLAEIRHDHDAVST
jgi:hypothetical protein